MRKTENIWSQETCLFLLNRSGWAYTRNPAKCVCKSLAKKYAKKETTYLGQNNRNNAEALKKSDGLSVSHSQQGYLFGL